MVAHMFSILTTLRCLDAIFEAMTRGCFVVSLLAMTPSFMIDERCDFTEKEIDHRSRDAIRAVPADQARMTRFCPTRSRLPLIRLSLRICATVVR